MFFYNGLGSVVSTMTFVLRFDGDSKGVASLSESTVTMYDMIWIS